MIFRCYPRRMREAHEPAMMRVVCMRLSAAGGESEAGASVNLLALFSLRGKEHCFIFFQKRKRLCSFSLRNEEEQKKKPWRTLSIRP